MEKFKLSRSTCTFACIRKIQHIKKGLSISTNLHLCIKYGNNHLSMMIVALEAHPVSPVLHIVEICISLPKFGTRNYMHEITSQNA